MSQRKEKWPVISTRIPPDQRKKLNEKHPTDGELSKVLRALVTKYLEGRILGLRIEA